MVNKFMEKPLPWMQEKNRKEVKKDYIYIYIYIYKYIYIHTHTHTHTQ